jgi:hypothetical protein
MLFGLGGAAIFAYSLLHHEYTFFARGFEPGWNDTIGPFLVGVCFFVYGLIGYLRKKE